MYHELFYLGIFSLLVVCLVMIYELLVESLVQ